MLGAKGSLGKFPWIDDDRQNPLTDLPFSEQDLNSLVDEIDAVLLTHQHPDHWDSKAHEILPKNLPIYCQPEDASMIGELGFKNVIPVTTACVFGEIEIWRTPGEHGLGEVGSLMGKVSGFVLKHKEKTLYIAGDTIWCDDVIKTIDEFSSSLIVVNGGGAKFNIGEHVTMNTSDIKQLLEYYSHNNIAVVHLETVSPVVESRDDIESFFYLNEDLNRIILPKDGDCFYV